MAWGRKHTAAQTPAWNQDDYHKAFAGKLKEQIEQGVAPWQKPWKPGEERLPKNIQTDKPYRGGNSIYLSVTQTAKGYSDNRWATYKQIKDMGGQVRKGEKATHVLFYKFDDERKKEQEQPDRPTTEGKAEREHTHPPMVRCYAVFNVEQADGLTLERKGRRPRATARMEGPPDGRACHPGERDPRRPRTRRSRLLQHADRQGDVTGTRTVRHGERLLPDRLTRTRARHRPPRPDGPRHPQARRRELRRHRVRPRRTPRRNVRHDDRRACWRRS